MEGFNVCRPAWKYINYMLTVFFRSQDIGLIEIRSLLDICKLLYTTKDSLVVVMKRPRHLRCEHVGKVCLIIPVEGEMVIC